MTTLMPHVAATNNTITTNTAGTRAKWIFWSPLSAGVNTRASVMAKARGMKRARARYSTAIAPTMIAAVRMLDESYAPWGLVLTATTEE